MLKKMSAPVFATTTTCEVPVYARNNFHKEGGG